MNRELPYWVATSAIPGVGTQTFNNFLKKFKTLKKFWEANEAEINRLKLDNRTREKVLSFRAKVDPKVYLDKVYEVGIKVVIATDNNYPVNLKHIQGAPALLYYKGSLLAKDRKAIAIVGSRRATEYGKYVTEKFAFELASRGVTIVSGLARGVDSYAHRAALKAGGRTIAVLGNGLNTVYPSENRQLAEEIAKNGAVVSEFPLGYPIAPGNFPARNRIISGLSLGVLVTEGAINSGSLITAGQAAEQGREVFAVPGTITSKMSEGVNSLIRDGVHVATASKDILEVLKI